MIKNAFLTGIFSTIILLIFCNCVSNQSQQTNESFKKDSIQLTTLIRKVYKWHMTNSLEDFPYEYEKPADTIFIGIDWQAYDRNIEIIKKTNFFTDQFISNHKTIALNIDSSIRKANIKWRNINDGIPFWDTNADDWCECQDYPDNYWEILSLHNLSIEDNTATFFWSWDKELNPDSHESKAVAKKIDGIWRINYLDGFKYYGTVEDYDKMMDIK